MAAAARCAGPFPPRRLAFCTGVLAVALVTAPGPQARQPAPRVSSAWGVGFRDIAARAGLRDPVVYGGVDRKRFIIETNGAGVALVDFDNDGWLDALTLSGTRLGDETRAEAEYAPGSAPSNRLYRNLRNGNFTDVTDAAGLRRTGWASSVCAGDYDNDGWTDLFVTYYGSNVLYRNRGDGRFEDVTSRAGLAAPAVRWGSGCTFVDYDRDGRADLFVANYLRFDLLTAPEPGKGPNCVWKGIAVNCGPKGLPTDTNLLYRNNGDGSFADVSQVSGIAKVTGRYPMTAVAADLDADGWSDIYVASDSTAAILYRNNRDGTFTDVALESGAAYSESGSPQAGMGLGVGDYNRDGLLDLLKTHFADDIPSLYRNLGKGLFEDVAAAAGLAVENRYVEWGAALPDLDNDGLQDVFYVTGNVYPEIERALPQYPHRGPRVVFRNLGRPGFVNVTKESGDATVAHSSRGAAFGDVDNDGDVDVLIMNMNEPPSLLQNTYSGGHGWILIKLEGTVSNRSAIGATVVVTSGGERQARAVLSQSSYYSHDDFRLHFGLGTQSKADRIDITWPSGRTQSRKDVQGGRVVTLREGSPR
ncbi:MAG TPA: CRTAC1 family protein [Vicinamibacterales bacterium]|nr:CRTAC1 family protein [Vicinamibacterales bacterium]